MPSNDEVILDMPNACCPSCGSLFDLSKNRVDKFSKQQRKEMNSATNSCSTSSDARRTYSIDPFPNGEDQPSTAPDKNFVVVSCSNWHCDQYNKFKVIRLARVQTPSVRVDLND